MSYSPAAAVGASLKTGAFALATMSAHGVWVKAANERFVSGPWSAKYGLGTYGVDEKTNTAWAVINFNGSFAVVSNL